VDVEANDLLGRLKVLLDVLEQLKNLGENIEKFLRFLSARWSFLWSFMATEHLSRVPSDAPLSGDVQKS
jgi:hypothetical protein